MVSSGGNALANPFEFRELMAASVGYDSRTVEEVQAAHEARQADRRRPNRGAKPKASAVAPPVTDPNTIPKSALDALEQLRTQGQPPS